MQQKKLILHYKAYIPIILLGIFSFLINYHYGFVGIMPMDNTVLYNGGYKVLNGYIPFTDYWLVTGPLLDYLNAFFFLINGVSWKTFIIHSSIFNLLAAVASYLLFINLGLSRVYSSLYSALISILFYPVVGTPFVDHHSTFFLMMAFYGFILAVNKENNFYFLLIPFLFCLSFLSKQTPAVYGLISIIGLMAIYCMYKKKYFKKILIFSIFGTLFSFLFLFIFFYLTNINFSNFFDQYILFASSIGDFRFSNYNFSFIDIIIKFKLLNIFIVILFISLIKMWISKKKEKKVILTILTVIFYSFTLIFHQYYTLNQNYIFFLIPFLCGIIHVFNEKIFDKKYILIFSIALCIFSVTKYHLRFNEHRKFNELEKADLSKAVNAGLLSNKLNGLKWITYIHPENPEKEINNLKEIIDILSQDSSKKTLITNYQFIASILNVHDNSPNQWHHPSVSFPLKNNEFFKKYKIFFIDNLKKNKVDFIYETIEKEDTITELILNKDCINKKRLSDMLVKIQIIKTCKDFQ